MFRSREQSHGKSDALPLLLSAAAFVALWLASRCVLTCCSVIGLTTAEKVRKLAFVLPFVKSLAFLIIAVSMLRGVV